MARLPAKLTTCIRAEDHSHHCCRDAFVTIVSGTNGLAARHAALPPAVLASSVAMSCPRSSTSARRRPRTTPPKTRQGHTVG